MTLTFNLRLATVMTHTNIDYNKFTLPPSCVFALAAYVYNKYAVMDKISESTRRSYSQIQSAVLLTEFRNCFQLVDPLPVTAWPAACPWTQVGAYTQTSTISLCYRTPMTRGYPPKQILASILTFWLDWFKISCHSDRGVGGCSGPLSTWPPAPPFIIVTVDV